MESGIPRGAAFFIWLCAKYSALSGLMLRCIASFPGRCPGLVYFDPSGLYHVIIYCQNEEGTRWMPSVLYRM